MNAPAFVTVQANSSGTPEKIRVPLRGLRPRSRSTTDLFGQIQQGPWLSVTFITDMWKINDEWWRGRDEEIERTYFDLLLENGRHMTVFHDMIRDIWYRQSS